MGETRWRTAVRWLWPFHGVPVRRADRIEAAVLVSVLTLTLLLLPIALALGSEAYASHLRAADEQSLSRVQATATLLVDAPPDPVGANGPGHVTQKLTAKVDASWLLPSGATRMGQVDADKGLRVGAHVPVWLDRDGNLASPPLTGADATGAGVMALLRTLLLGVVSLMIVFLAARLGLNRYRIAGWHRDWAKVEPLWSRRAS
jgi:hypothetical protein